MRTRVSSVLHNPQGQRAVAETTGWKPILQCLPEYQALLHNPTGSTRRGRDNRLEALFYIALQTIHDPPAHPAAITLRTWSTSASVL
jgi:hypothetical protein